MNIVPLLIRLVTYVVGALEGIFAARLLLKLLAARPDNPIFKALFTITQPFVGLLAFLDAQQPRFGAILEFSTLAWMLLLGLIIVALHLIGDAHRRSATRVARRTSNL